MSNLNIAPKAIELHLTHNPDVIGSMSNLINTIKDTMHQRQNFETCLSIDDKLKNTMEKAFDCTVRQGISGGCYGARNGKDSKGFTIYLSLDELPDRWLDDSNDEIVNYWALLNEFGSLDRTINNDTTIERYEKLFGLELQHENSYNYEGNQCPYGLCTIDFKYAETNNGAIAFVKFHCGGDVRGNYTKYYVFSFDDLDDLHSAVFPMHELSNE